MRLRPHVRCARARAGTIEPRTRHGGRTGFNRGPGRRACMPASTRTTHVLCTLRCVTSLVFTLPSDLISPAGGCWVVVSSAHRLCVYRIPPGWSCGYRFICVFVVSMVAPCPYYSPGWLTVGTCGRVVKASDSSSDNASCKGSTPFGFNAFCTCKDVCGGADSMKWHPEHVHGVR